QGGAAAVIGVVLLLLGAAGRFGELQDALNTVWKVEAKPGRGVWGFVRNRFLSMTMVFGTAFLLLVSLVVNAALSALGRRFGASAETVWGHALNIVASRVVI